MKTFHVTVERIVTDVFEVEAESEEAIQLMWDNSMDFDNAFLFDQDVDERIVYTDEMV